MIPAIASLFLAASVSAGCIDSTFIEAVENPKVLVVTPDEAPEDSCAWENLRTQNSGSANTAERESSRASLSLAQAPGSPVTSTVRHRANSKGWSSRIEVREDSLTRRQLGWNGNGWHVLGGDMEDTTMPLLPLWLPSRTLPEGWKAASQADALFPSTSIPQGFGAGTVSPAWNAYALSAWNAVQGGGTPPWEKAWQLHHVAAGASAAFPWMASLHLSETRISRSGQDSVAEELIALSLASPHQRIELNGAWASTRTNPRGGFAAGIGLHQPLANFAKLDLTLRQRASDWTTSWDPTASSGGAGDSAVVGAGEAIASLRAPFKIQKGKGAMTGEAWAAWNPEASTRKFGTRGKLEWRRREIYLELRGVHRQWVTTTGYRGFHDYLAAETGLGRHPEWRTGVYRLWERSSERQGISFAMDTRWRNLNLRPGLQLESNQDQELSSLASLWMNWKLGGGWTLAATGSAPSGPNLVWNQARWQATLRYSGSRYARDLNYLRTKAAAKNPSYSLSPG